MISEAVQGTKQLSLIKVRENNNWNMIVKNRGVKNG
jgi:hypothetical protein